ncbi:MAG: hypothetical protein WBG50_02870 [Desulfomonilaceae bacterium]
MVDERADKDALMRFVKQGVGIISPRLKQAWELYDNIQIWRDDKEKEKVRRFLLAYNDLLVFLEELEGKAIGVRTKSGTFGCFPGADAEKFAAVITDTVEAAAVVDWESQPLEPTEVRKMYQEMSKAVQEMSPLIVSVFSKSDE